MAWIDLREPPFDTSLYTTSAQSILFGRNARISTAVMFAFLGNGIVLDGAAPPKLGLDLRILRVVVGDAMLCSGWSERVGRKRRYSSKCLTDRGQCIRHAIAAIFLAMFARNLRGFPNSN